MYRLDQRDFYVAPLDPAQTKPGELAESLPNLANWDPDVLEHERETVFRNSWMCVPKQLFRVHNPAVRSIWVREGPDLLAALEHRGEEEKFRILGESVMLLRGFKPKGIPELHCFKNMCPHARYPLLEFSIDEANQPRIVCKQHGLTCDEDGNFLGHPAFPNPTEEQKRCLSLVGAGFRYSVQEWQDFFFVCRGEAPVSFQDTMQPIWDSLARMPLQDFRYKKTGAEQRIVEGNWKLQAQNYNDWLHIRYIHRRPYGLADSLDLSSAQMELFSQATLMWAYAANPDDGLDPAVLPDRFRDPKHPEKRVFALWWFVFPNLALNFYPWGLSVNIFMPTMVDTEKMQFDPEKTEFLWYHYVWDEDKYHEGLDSRWLNRIVDLEDVEALKLVAENLRSRAHPWHKGLFGNGEGPNTEKGPHWLNRKIYEAMFPDWVQEANRASALPRI